MRAVSVAQRAMRRFAPLQRWMSGQAQAVNVDLQVPKTETTSGAPRNVDLRTSKQPTLAESWSKIRMVAGQLPIAPPVLAGDASSREIEVISNFVCRGWVRSVRTQRDFVFLMVSDGTTATHLQVVYGGPDCTELEKVKKLTLGSSLVAQGTLIRNERNPPTTLDGYELRATKIDIISTCPSVPSKVTVTVPSANASSEHIANENTPGAAKPQPQKKVTLNFQGYPLQKKYMSPEFLRTIPQHRLRTNLYSAILRVRSESTYLFHQFFRQEGFHAIHAPIITPLDCEGAGELFEVLPASTLAPLHKLQKQTKKNSPDSEIDSKISALNKPLAEYFGSRAYLSVSGQLYAEIAAAAVPRVYTFGPTFRAENSNTTRHLSEFWMLEPEIAFCDLTTLCDYVEDSIQFVTQQLLQSCLADFEKLEALGAAQAGHVDNLRLLASSKFARITYTEAVEILQRAFTEQQQRMQAGTPSENKDQPLPYDAPPVWGDSLSSLHEKYLADYYFAKPVFVTDYPASIKPFYMKVNRNCEEGKATVACMDLLVPGVGELCGGSQREDDIDTLLMRMLESGMKVDDYKWYLELRRFGGVPHAGWGMGFERYIKYVCGLINIRDTVLAPRAPDTLEI